MELFDNLASVGLSGKILQFIILAGVAVFLLGLYWRFVVIGAGILFCVVVLAMPSKKEPVIDPVVESKPAPQEYKIEPMPLQPPVVEVKPEVKPDANETKEQADERMFLEDCKLHSGYTADKCNSLWSENKAEIEKSAWRYKHDKSYMRKVKYAS